MLGLCMVFDALDLCWVTNCSLATEVPGGFHGERCSFLFLAPKDQGFNSLETKNQAKLNPQGRFRPLDRQGYAIQVCLITGQAVCIRCLLLLGCTGQAR